MTVYKLHGMKISPVQLKKLTKGFGVRIPHNGLSGPVQLHLTQQQVNKIARKKAKKQGMVLKLSQAQIKHNVRQGGSLADIMKALKPYAKIGAKFLAPIALNEAKKYAKRKYSNQGDLIDGISSLIGKQVDGMGVNSEKRDGAGWLSWLTKPLGDALGDVVAPIGTIVKDNPELAAIAANAAMKSLAGRGVKPKRAATKRVKPKKAKTGVKPKKRAATKPVKPEKAKTGAKPKKAKTGSKPKKRAKGLLSSLFGFGVKKESTKKDTSGGSFLLPSGR